MKKLLCIAVLLLPLFFVNPTLGADVKLTGLTAATTVAPTDLLLTTADPQGTPASRKLEAARLTAVTISTSTGPTVLNQGYYYANEASSGAMGYTLPTIASSPSGTQVPPGWQACFGNYQAKTSAITLTPPASHSFYYKGAATGATKTLVSGGAAGDLICVVATAENNYQVLGDGKGTWTLTP